MGGWWQLAVVLVAVPRGVDTAFLLAVPRGVDTVFLLAVPRGVDAVFLLEFLTQGGQP